MYTWIFSIYVFYPKFFHNCYLPDVASGVTVLLHIISLVPAICIVGEDDEPHRSRICIDRYAMLNSLKHCTDIL